MLTMCPPPFPSTPMFFRYCQQCLTALHHPLNSHHGTSMITIPETCNRPCQQLPIAHIATPRPITVWHGSTRCLGQPSALHRISLAHPCVRILTTHCILWICWMANIFVLAVPHHTPRPFARHPTISSHLNQTYHRC
jgi:hypothetical protein